MDKQTETVARHLEEAMQYLSAIPVKGDGVELMAAAKEQLRMAYRAMTEATQEEDAKEGDGDNAG